MQVCFVQVVDTYWLISRVWNGKIRVPRTTLSTYIYAGMHGMWVVVRLFFRLLIPERGDVGMRGVWFETCHAYSKLDGEYLSTVSVDYCFYREYRVQLLLPHAELIKFDRIFFPFKFFFLFGLPAPPPCIRAIVLGPVYRQIMKKITKKKNHATKSWQIPNRCLLASYPEHTPSSAGWYGSCPNAHR